LPDFDDDQMRQRVDQAIAVLNSAPLLARLREALACDGVPYTEYEFEIIHKMRKARNDFAH
jgi:predicted DNA binding CopG/RHH family protein